MSLHDTSGMLISVSRSAEGRICDSASSKSSRSTRRSCSGMRNAARWSCRLPALRRSRLRPASRQSSIRSAPRKPCVRRAISSRKACASSDERHFAGVDFQDFAPAGDVGRADEDFAVEAARPAERRIDRVDAVGGADHDHGIDALEAVHQREQLRHRAGVGMRAGLAALGRHGVELVDEDDRGRMVAGLVEHAAQVGFGLAGIGADHVGAVDVIEARVDFVGDRAREMRFAGAGRAIEDDAARRVDAEMAIDVRVRERQLHQLADELDLLVQAADVLEGDVEGAVRQMAVVIVERRPRSFVDDAGAVRRPCGFRRSCRRASSGTGCRAPRRCWPACGSRPAPS